MAHIMMTSADYYDGENYDIVSYNNFVMSMTQGNERTQAKGLICAIADGLKKRERAQAERTAVVEAFANNLRAETKRAILYDGDNGVEPFKFSDDIIAENPGLDGLLNALKIFVSKGELYHDFQNFKNHIYGLIRGKRYGNVIMALLQNIEETYSTPYEREKKLISLLELLTSKLKEKSPYQDILFRKPPNRDIKSSL